MKKIVVLYHASCLDGFSAAWAAWKKFGDKADYIPVSRGDPLPTGLKNKTVYSLDFIHQEPMLSKLLQIAKEVIGIDHHISSKAAIQRTSRYFFDIKHSGSVLAWKYFHPRKPTPLLLKYIEDRDLWKFKLPSSKEITAYISLFPLEFLTWSRLARTLENKKKKKKVTEIGGFLERYQRNLVQEAAEDAFLVRFEGYNTLAVNSPLFRSELGAKLVKKYPPIAIIWFFDGAKHYVSLRSNGRVNVAKLAEKYGGGGHKAAAAFIIPKNKKLPWKVLGRP